MAKYSRNCDAVAETSQSFILQKRLWLQP